MRLLPRHRNDQLPSTAAMERSTTTIKIADRIGARMYSIDARFTSHCRLLQGKLTKCGEDVEETLKLATLDTNPETMKIAKFSLAFRPLPRNYIDVLRVPFWLPILHSRLQLEYGAHEK